VARETREDFDRYRDAYREEIEDSISFSGADLDFFTRAKAHALLELTERGVGAPGGLTFLDVGCGPGETDLFLKGRVGRLSGVDVSAGMLERARRSNPWAEYREYSAGERLPYEETTFDVCFAICVFHHVPLEQRVPLLEEMIRVCRPGGLIVLFEHNPLNPLTRKAVAGCDFDRDAQLMTRRQASRLLGEAGLDSPRGRYIEFFTRDSRLLRGVEGRLGWLPLGAQYAVYAHRPRGFRVEALGAGE
jgi:SAM-dependent methyltransferase